MGANIKTITFSLAVLFLAALCGCASHTDTGLSPMLSNPPVSARSQSLATFTLYFHRDVNYRGAGRRHLLTLDGKTVGPLGPDNYYRIEMWPGQYHLSVYLPVEHFLGRTSPSARTSMQLVIRPTNVSGTGVYKYTDGEGIFQVAQDEQPPIALLTEQRMLSGDLSARDTAQVKFLYDARYDGPSLLQKAHGQGTLTWEDGSRYMGRFDYGKVTGEGKFFVPGGPVYMGLLHKGRPIGPGVWMTSNGKILFAGKFLDERPHGAGIRAGQSGPEFCEYDNGNDITLTLREVVLKAIEEEDRRVADPAVQSTLIVEKEAIEDTPSKHTADNTDPKTTNLVDLDAVDNQNSTAPASQKTDTSMASGKPQKQTDQPVAPLSPYLRILAKEKEVLKSTHDRIAKKREWCNEEFRLGRRLCFCAPFADDFDNWRSCESR